jgi:pSer/pThr/pTyr-binding forkhead associated (FHA) protein
LHARIVWDGGYWIEDLGSSNGTFVNVDPITSPAYTVARSAPLDETQNPLLAGFTETPQALFRFESVIGATPG